jgi:hypothetical protein
MCFFSGFQNQRRRQSCVSSLVSEVVIGCLHVSLLWILKHDEPHPMWFISPPFFQNKLWMTPCLSPLALLHTYSRLENWTVDSMEFRELQIHTSKSYEFGLWRLAWLDQQTG